MSSRFIPEDGIDRTLVIGIEAAGALIAAMPLDIGSRPATGPRRSPQDTAITPRGAEPTPAPLLTPPGES